MMDQEGNQERAEVYERIPWEMLDKGKGDRQWLLYAVGGAVVLGALAYSFVSNRQTPQPVAEEVGNTVSVVEPTSPAPIAPPPPVVTNPVVVSEADLYAVDPERLVDQAVAHAEWFVAEYFTLDGSEQHTETLISLMPAGIPLPSAPDGTRVFVESAGGIGATEVEPLRYEVDVLVRYLLALGEEAYRRQPPVVATVEVVVGDLGPQVTLPPRIAATTHPDPMTLTLEEVPQEVIEKAAALVQVTEVIGGSRRGDGSWTVVVLAAGPDGVTRPVSLLVP